MVATDASDRPVSRKPLTRKLVGFTLANDGDPCPEECHLVLKGDEIVGRRGDAVPSPRRDRLPRRGARRRLPDLQRGPLCAQGDRQRRLVRRAGPGQAVLLALRGGRSRLRRRASGRRGLPRVHAGQQRRRVRQVHEGGEPGAAGDTDAADLTICIQDGEPVVINVVQSVVHEPITLVGFTALSVDTITNFSTAKRTDRSATFLVPPTFTFTASKGLFSINGTCL